MVEAARICAVTLALGGFSRAFARSWAGRLGVAASTLLLSAASLLPSYWIAKWPLLMAARWRLVVLVVGALALRLLWARRHPATAAWRGGRRFEWLLLPLASGLVSVVELAWNQPVGGREWALEEGYVAHVPEWGDPLIHAQRIWLKHSDSYTALPLRGKVKSLVRHHSGVISFDIDGRGWYRGGVGILTPEGDKLVCPTSTYSVAWWFDADARSGTALMKDRSLVVVDLDEGCGTTSEIPARLPDDYGYSNEIRAARGIPLFRAGDVPGTVVCPREDGSERVLDLVTGQYL